MDADKIELSTFQLHEDRKLVVVLRGINQSLSEDEILQEIKTKVPAVIRVHRMRSKENIWPLVAVHLDAKAQSISSH